MSYIVEGWSHAVCVRVRRVVRPTTVISEAWHQMLDLGADRVWIRNDEGEAVWMFDGFRWQKHLGDDRLDRAIEDAN